MQSETESMQSTDRANSARVINLGLFSGVLGGICLLIVEFFDTGINPLTSFTLAWAILFGLVAGIIAGFIGLLTFAFPRVSKAAWGREDGSPWFTLVWGGGVLVVASLVLPPIVGLLSQTKYAPSLGPVPATLIALVLIWGTQRLVRHFFPVLGLRLSWSLPVVCVLFTRLFFEVVRPLAPATSFPVVFALLVVYSLAVMQTLRGMGGATAVGGFSLLAGVIAFIHLMFWDGKEPSTAFLATTGPVSASFAQGWVRLSDLDGDGFSYVGNADCAPFDAAVHALAIEMVGNAVDENCSGADLAKFNTPTPPVISSTVHPKNVFFVSIDTLRFDAVGLTVKGKSLTPNIDRFSEHGIRYLRAYSPSTYTNEAMPSIMSSEYPQRWHSKLTYYGQEPTLAQILQKEGYQTEAVIAFPWLHDGAVLGFDYVDNELGWVTKHGAENGGVVVDRILNRIDVLPAKSLTFGWLHIFEPHAPNVGGLHDDWLGNDARGRYLQDVNEADAAFGKFIDGLVTRGLLESSVVVLFADHGEALGEHNIATHLWASWNSIVHVPLVVMAPGYAPAQISDVVSTLDIVPTVASLVVGKIQGARDGNQLPPFASVESGPAFVVADSREATPITRAMIQGDFKVMWDIPSHAWLLFDVVADPNEKHPLDDPERLSQMRTALLNWWGATNNDVLIKRKADLWESRELVYPIEFKGDVGNMLELKRR